MKEIDRPDIAFAKGQDILSAFAAAASADPDGIAILFKDRAVTKGKLRARVNRVANALAAMGVTTGDRVAILSLNSVEYVEAFFGALAAGACVVPLPNMASPQALRLMIEDSRPRALFVSAGKRDLVEPFASGPDNPAVDGLIGFDFSGDGWRSYEEWLSGAPDKEPDVEIRKNDEFNIIYSSGTTGVPKGISHTHAFRKAFTDNLELLFVVPGMVNIVSTPFYSNTTMVTWLASMRWGVPYVLMDKFDAREFLALCEKHKVTIAMLVPVQYDRILRVPDFDRFDLSSLVLKMCTSAPLGPEMKRKILDRMPGELAEVYGLTEGGVATMLLASAYRDKLESVGQPVPGCEIKVIDDEGKELAPGKVGELVGRGPLMMKGYLNRDEATQQMLWFDADGKVFLRSGDLGRMDADGFVYVMDRKKDMIISGGFNVYPTDLENELLSHGQVREAAVVGVPDEKWGETPVAFVVPEPGSNLTPQALLSWVNARLGKLQRISRLQFMEELPKSPIGKVLKKELRRAG